MQEDPLEKEMATHLSILAWEIPQPKEPGRLQFHAVTRVRHDFKQQSLYFQRPFTRVPTSSLTFHSNSLKSCPTLCDPLDCSPPGSSAHDILQAEILE